MQPHCTSHKTYHYGLKTERKTTQPSPEGRGLVIFRQKLEFINNPKSYSHTAKALPHSGKTIPVSSV